MYQVNGQLSSSGEAEVVVWHDGRIIFLETVAGTNKFIADLQRGVAQALIFLGAKAADTGDDISCPVNAIGCVLSPEDERELQAAIEAENAQGS